MGRKTKTSKSKKKIKQSKVASKPIKSNLTTYTVEQLLEKTEECMDSFQYELAQRFCERALEMAPDNTAALEVSGSVALELGDMDSAKQYFERAVELEPDQGHSKYMYLGQLMTDKDAAHCFLKGIELMKKLLEAEQASNNEAAASAVKPAGSVTKRDISSAYCSVAEIYMTDACFEEDAEAQCLHNLEQALATDETNPEVHHLRASYHLSKDDKQSAEVSMEKGLSLWLPQLQEAEKPDGKNDIDPVNVCSLGYPARVNAVKILIELEKYDIASEVLELLLDEDDTVVEVWYLLGWANYLQGEDYKSTARYYLKKAHQVSVQTQCEDDQLVAHIEELLEEIGPGEDGESGAENGEENGEMDIDSSTDSDQEVGGSTEQEQTGGATSQDMEH